jgi:hypothetical protein
MTKRTPRERLDPPREDKWSRRARVGTVKDAAPAPDDVDEVGKAGAPKNGSVRTVPVGVNDNALLRSGLGRPRGRPNEVTRQVAMGLKSGQSLSTAQVKRGLADVVTFLGYYQNPTDREIAEFLGEGGGGHRGYLLRTALSRRATFERWYERAFIPHQIKAQLEPDPDSLLSRLMQTIQAARQVREQQCNVIDLVPSRRSIDDNR